MVNFMIDICKLISFAPTELPELFLTKIPVFCQNPKLKPNSSLKTNLKKRSTRGLLAHC